MDAGSRDTELNTLSVTELARATGVLAGTLRMWERRHGFPTSVRKPGAHRRFCERDVELVRAVLAHRNQGMSLGAAIERVRQQALAGPGESIFAALRRAHPELQARRMGASSLLALSRAIEDQQLALGGGGAMIGCFQTQTAFARSSERWNALAHAAALAVAFAGFRRPERLRAGPLLVPIPADHPLAREWTVAISSERLCACLAAWEVPREPAEGRSERQFEAVFSLAPQVSRLAMEVAGELLARHDRSAAERLEGLLAQPAPDGSGALADASELTLRALGQLEQTRRA